MIDHSLDGVTGFLERTTRVRGEHGFDRLLVFMETTSHFWKNVANVLERQGVAYRTIAPLAVDRKREIEHLTYAKGDFRDAELIARLGAEGHWLDRVLEREKVWIELAALVREHETMLDLEIRERHRIRTLLELAVPEFLDVFRDPLKTTARAVLRLLTSPPVQTHEELRTRVASLKAGGKGSRRLQVSKARQLDALLKLAPSFGVERCLSAAFTRIAFAIDRFDQHARHRELVRETMLRLYEQTSLNKWLDTIPGVDPFANALLLGLVGDPRRYDRPSCLVKFAGIEPRENHSGEGEGAHSISRRGMPLLRLVLFRVVLGFLKSNAEFGAYMKRLVDRDQNPLAYHQAFVAASNKYLRLVYALCSTQTAYDPSKIVAPAQPSRRGAIPIRAQGTTRRQVGAIAPPPSSDEANRTDTGRR